MKSTHSPLTVSAVGRCFLSSPLVGILFTLPAFAELPGPAGEPPIPVIDVHTHVFNGHDLPLAGILNARGVPLGTNYALAKVLNSLTARDDLDDPLPFPPRQSGKSLAEKRTEITTWLLDNVRASQRTPEAASLFSALSPDERDQLIEYAGASETAEAKFWSEISQPERELEILARALARADFPPGESAAPTTIKGAGDADQSGYAAFIGVMTEGNLHIAWGLQKTQYPAVDLFVHHMMDIEKPYATSSVVPFSEQMNRMTRLDQRLDGKFIHFVAFDPFRRRDSLESVKRGLKAGAVGVKFYPPSGYRATNNKIPPQPPFYKPGSQSRWTSRYDELTNDKLDGFNEALFAYCEANDVPIFTHCTPKGFEADDDYGQMADPQYWGPVLEKHKKLRLCFGHSGGHAFWFPTNEASEESKFGKLVVDLCLRHPNVYCEVGYLDQILDPNGSDLFKKRLKEQINRPSTTGKWKFGDKIMYGSDWHMIHKEKNHEQYPVAFNKLFADPVLGPWQRAFFCRNAIAYIKLSELVAKPDVTAKQKAHWEALLAKAAAGPKSGSGDR